jgi:Phage integrase, N-terminal SAM-like domain
MSETHIVSPLRQRMLEDMVARKLNPRTQRSHVSSCKRFAAWLKRSPDTATPDEVRRFQLYLVDSGASICQPQPDHDRDLGRLLHWQVGRLFAFQFQDAARVDAGKAVRFGKVAVAANGRSAQREASRVQRLKSIFNCLSSAMC